MADDKLTQELLADLLGRVRAAEGRAQRLEERVAMLEGRLAAVEGRGALVGATAAPAVVAPAAKAAPSAPKGAKAKAETPLEKHKQEERARILAALEATGWNRLKAAEELGMPRRTFHRRIKEYGIQ